MKVTFKKLSEAVMGLFTANPELDAGVQKQIMDAAEADAEEAVGKPESAAAGAAEEGNTDGGGNPDAAGTAAGGTPPDSNAEELQKKLEATGKELADMKAGQAKRLEEMTAELQRLKDWKAKQDAAIGEPGDGNVEGKKAAANGMTEKMKARQAELEDLKGKHPDLMAMFE